VPHWPGATCLALKVAGRDRRVEAEADTHPEPAEVVVAEARKDPDKPPTMGIVLQP